MQWQALGTTSFTRGQLIGGLILLLLLGVVILFRVLSSGA